MKAAGGTAGDFLNENMSGSGAEVGGGAGLSYDQLVLRLNETQANLQRMMNDSHNANFDTQSQMSGYSYSPSQMGAPGHTPDVSFYDPSPSGGQLTFKLHNGAVFYLCDGQAKPEFREAAFKFDNPKVVQVHFPEIDKTATIPPNEAPDVCVRLLDMFDAAGVAHNLRVRDAMRLFLQRDKHLRAAKQILGDQRRRVTALTIENERLKRGEGSGGSERAEQQLHALQLQLHRLQQDADAFRQRDSERCALIENLQRQQLRAEDPGTASPDPALLQELEALRLMQARLTAELEQSRASEALKAQEETEITAMVEQVLDKNDQLANAQANSSQAIVTLQEQVRTLHEQSSLLANTSLESESPATREELEHAARRTEHLERQLASATEQLSGMSAALRLAQDGSAEAALQAQAADLQRLNAALEQTTAECGGLLTDAQKAEAARVQHVQQLEARLQQLESSGAEQAQLRGQVGDLLSSNAALEQTSQQCSDYIRGMQEADAAKMQRVSELENASAAAAHALQESQAYARQLEAQLSQQPQGSGVDAGEHERLTAQVAQLLEANTKLEETVEQCQAVIRSMQQAEDARVRHVADLEEAARGSAGAADELLRCQQECRRSQELIKALEDRLSESTELTAAMQCSEQQRADEHARLLDRVAEADAALAAERTQHTHLQSALSAGQSKEEALKQELEAAAAHVQVARAEEARLTEQMALHEAQQPSPSAIASLQTVIAALEGQLKQSTDEVADRSAHELQRQRHTAAVEGQARQAVHEAQSAAAVLQRLEQQVAAAVALEQQRAHAEDARVAAAAESARVAARAKETIAALEAEGQRLSALLQEALQREHLRIAAVQASQERAEDASRTEALVEQVREAGAATQKLQGIVEQQQAVLHERQEAEAARISTVESLEAQAKAGAQHAAETEELRASLAAMRAEAVLARAAIAALEEDAAARALLEGERSRAEAARVDTVRNAEQASHSVHQQLQGSKDAVAELEQAAQQQARLLAERAAGEAQRTEAYARLEQRCSDDAGQARATCARLEELASEHTALEASRGAAEAARISHCETLAAELQGKQRAAEASCDEADLRAARQDVSNLVGVVRGLEQVVEQQGALLGETASLEQQRIAYFMEGEEQRREAAGVRAQLGEAQEQVAAAQRSSGEQQALEGKLRELEGACDAATQLTAAVQEGEQARIAACDALEGETAQLQASNTSLSRNLADAQAVIARLEQTCADCQQQLDAALKDDAARSDRVRDLELASHSSAGDAQQAIASLQKLLQEAQDLEASRAGEEAQRIAAYEALAARSADDSPRHTIGDLEAALEAAAAHGESCRHADEQRVAYVQKLEAELSEAKAAVKRLEDVVNDSADAAEHSRVEAELAAAKDTIKRLEDAANDSDAAAETITALESALEAATAREHERSEAEAQRVEHLQQIEAELAETKVSSNDNAAVTETITALESALEAASVQAREYCDTEAHRVEHLQGVEAELAETKATIKRLEDTTNDADAATETITALEDALEAASAQERERSAAEAQRVEHLQNIEAELAEVRGSGDDSNDNAAVTETITSLEDALEAASVQAREYCDTEAQRVEHLQGVEAELAEAKATIKRLEDELNEAQEWAEDDTVPAEKLAEAEERIAELVSQAEEARSAVAADVTEAEGTTPESAAVDAELAEAKATIKRLEDAANDADAAAETITALESALEAASVQAREYCDTEAQRVEHLQQTEAELAETKATIKRLEDELNEAQEWAEDDTVPAAKLAEAEERIAELVSQAEEARSAVAADVTEAEGSAPEAATDAELAEAKATIKRLEDELNEAQEWAEGDTVPAAKLAEAEERIAELVSQVEEKRSAVAADVTEAEGTTPESAVDAELAEAKATIKRLEDATNDSDAAAETITALESALEAATAQEHERSEAEAQRVEHLQQIEAELAETKATIKRLEDELNEAQEWAEDDTVPAAKLAEAEERIAELVSQAEEARSAVTTDVVEASGSEGALRLETELTEAKATIKRLEDELNEAQEWAEDDTVPAEKLAEAEERIAELVSQAEEARSAVAADVTEAEGTTPESAAVDAELAEAKATIKRLEDAANDADAAAETITALESALESASVQAREYCDTEAQRVEHLQGVEAELAETKATIKRPEDELNEAQEWAEDDTVPAAKLAEAEERIAELVSQAEEARSAVAADVTEADRTVPETTDAELAEAKATIKRLEDELNEAQEWAEDDTVPAEKLAEAEERIAELVSQVEEARSAVTTDIAADAVADVTIPEATTDAELAEAKATIKRREDELNEAREWAEDDTVPAAKLAEAEERIAELVSQVEEKRSAVTTDVVEASGSEDTLRLETELTEAKATIKRLEDELNEAQEWAEDDTVPAAKLAEAEERIAELVSQAEEARSAVAADVTEAGSAPESAVDAELAEAKATIKRLEDELNEAQEWAEDDTVPAEKLAEAEERIAELAAQVKGLEADVTEATALAESEVEATAKSEFVAPADEPVSVQPVDSWGSEDCIAAAAAAAAACASCEGLRSELDAATRRIASLELVCSPCEGCLKTPLHHFPSTGSHD